MIIRLQTRCGCTRLVDVDKNRTGDTYEVAILQDIPWTGWSKDVSSVSISTAKRIFRYRGEDYDGIPIFLEEI